MTKISQKIIKFLIVRLNKSNTSIYKKGGFNKALFFVVHSI
jgi:hypothetical protein